MRAYVDADVLIWHLRGEHKARSFLRRLQADPQVEPWIGAMQRAEVVFFAKSDELEATINFLSLFATAPVDETTIDRAGALYRRWNASHGVDPNDAILAATAIVTNGRIFTLNRKHYPMPEVSVERAW